MTTTIYTAKCKDSKESDGKQPRTQILVCWLAIFAFAAGCVTVGLIYHIRAKSDEWLFDLPLLMGSLAFARSYALRLLESH